MRLHLPSLAFLLVAASVAESAPADWTAFVQCTREFAPKRTPGHFETIVQSGRAVEKCYPTAPPTSPVAPAGETGPDRPSPDPENARDVACDHLPDAIRQWSDYVAKLNREQGKLQQQIWDAEEGIEKLDGILDDLRINTDLLSAACSRAQARYMSEMHEAIARARDTCPRRPPPVVTDCLDTQIEQEVTVLDESNTGRTYNRLCGIAREATVAFDDNQRVRNRLQTEIDGWQSRVHDYVRQIGRAERMLESMKKRQKDECRKK